MLPGGVEENSSIDWTITFRFSVDSPWRSNFWQSAAAQLEVEVIVLSPVCCMMLYHLHTKFICLTPSLSLPLYVSRPVAGRLPRVRQSRAAAAAVTRRNVPWAPWARRPTTRAAPTTAPSPAARPPPSPRAPPPPPPPHGSVSIHTNVFKTKQSSDEMRNLITAKSGCRIIKVIRVVVTSFLYNEVPFT